MNWAFVSLGFLLLLSSSFLDNIRGPLLPVLATTFHLTHSDSGAFLIAGSLGGILSMIALVRISHETTERKVLQGLILYSLGVIGFSFLVTGFWSLLLFGVAMGASLSAIGAMSNLVVIQGTNKESRGKALSLLHTMYGFGSFLAPVLVGATLLSPFSWHTPLLILGGGLILISLAARRILPEKKTAEIATPEKVSLNGFQLFTVLMFSTYVAGEVMVSMWMVTYLVETHGFTVTDASNTLGNFFLCMMFSRLFTFLTVKPRTEKIYLLGALSCAILFYGMGLLVNPKWLSGIGLFGPFFPLLLGRVTRLFHGQSKNITLWIIGVNSLFIMASHLAMGWVADQKGTVFAYKIPSVVLIVSLALVLLFLKMEKKVE